MPTTTGGWSPLSSRVSALLATSRVYNQEPKLSKHAYMVRAVSAIAVLCVFVLFFYCHSFTSVNLRETPLDYDIDLHSILGQFSS